MSTGEFFMDWPNKITPDELAVIGTEDCGRVSYLRLACKVVTGKEKGPFTREQLNDIGTVEASILREHVRCRYSGGDS